MTTFIIWPKTIDEAFRSAYMTIVEETIQDNPAETETHFMVGSSKITGDHVAALESAFPSAAFRVDYPEEFIVDQ